MRVNTHGLEKCAALQIVFEYFEPFQQMHMQGISRKFYNYIIPSILRDVKRNRVVSGNYIEHQMQETTKVIVFEGQKKFYIFSPSTNYTWVPRDIKVIDQSVDVAAIEYGWPKIVQINADEYLLVGGNALNTQQTRQIGIADCLKLNIKTCRLTKVASLPSAKMASQVIFIPPETGYMREKRDKSNY